MVNQQKKRKGEIQGISIVPQYAACAFGTPDMNDRALRTITCRPPPIYPCFTSTTSPRIGRACCVHLAKLGAKIVAADLDITAAQDTGSLITNEWCACEVDVSNEKSVEAMVATVVNSFGRLDGAVNAAGIEGTRARLHETSSANFDRVLGVNLKGVFLCMRAEIAQMLKQPPPGAGGASTFFYFEGRSVDFFFISLSGPGGIPLHDSMR